MARYERGDRVRVEGYGGRTAVLVVWEDFGYGVSLCSEHSYQQRLRGDDLAPLVGFPRVDVQGLSTPRGEQGAGDGGG